MIVAVTLTAGEIMSAGSVGLFRASESVASGRRDQHGRKDDGGGVLDHVNGAGAELAVAKHLNLTWNAGVRTFKGADVGQGIQVRWRSQPRYELLIRPDDNPEHAYVLVRGVMPTFEIVGWIRGRNAQRKEWLKAYGGRPHAWFVPDDALRPLLRAAA